MGNLPADIEQQLASMNEGEWAAFTARVRAPDATEQLRTVLSKHISGDRLAAVLKVANPAAFADGSGAVDEAKVLQICRSLFGSVRDGGPQSQPGPGTRGEAEAAKRFGATNGNPAPRHNGGAREAARRFGKEEN